ncbi:MAG: hypothetical protein KJ556_20015 [Gammaproteobacteria bacterium]|nr:hypothetical protein [Gammaproteobacteria bacterium]
MDKAKILLLAELLNEYMQSDEHNGNPTTQDEHFFVVLDELDAFCTDISDAAAVVVLTDEAASAVKAWYVNMFGADAYIGKNALNSIVTDIVYSHLVEMRDGTITPFDHEVSLVDDVIKL